MITIQTPHGLHLRVAAKIVEASRQHKARVTFYKDGQEASAESIMELLVLAAAANSQVTVTADGEDEQQVVEQIGLVLMDGAGI